MSDLKTQIEAVIDIAEYELARHWSSQSLALRNATETDQRMRADLLAGTKWLRANLNYILADAQFDGRD
jgi:hypothetical protein